MNEISRTILLYEDIKRISNLALELWRHAYVSSVKDTVPKNWNELISIESLHKVLTSLDITKVAQEFPLQNWETYFDTQMSSIHSCANKVIEQHGCYLESNVLNVLLTIANYKHHEISSIRALDRQAMIPRPTNLGSYILLNEKWFNSILSIYDYVVCIHKSLINYEIDDVKAPIHFEMNILLNHKSASFDKGVYEDQVQKYLVWQEEYLISGESLTTIH